YAPFLKQVMRVPVWTVTIAVISFLISIFLATQVGAVFIPDLDEGDLALQAWRPPSVSLEQSIESTTQVEQVLMQFPETVTVVSKTGRPEIATDPMGVETSDIFVLLKRQESLSPLAWPLALVGIISWPEDHWPTTDSVENLTEVLFKVHRKMTGVKEFTPELKEKLQRRGEEIFNGFAENKLNFEKEKLIFAMDNMLKDYVPVNNFSYSQPIELRFQELIAGVRSDIGISLYGPDLKVLEKTGDEIVQALQKVPGAADVRAQQIAGLPSIRMKINRAAVARYGINVADVLDVVRSIGGTVVGQVLEGQPRFALQVRFGPSWRQSLDDLKQLKIADPKGRQIPLEQLVDMEVKEGPAQVLLEAISRRLLIECNVRGRDLAGFVADAQRTVEREVKLPTGYYTTWGGQFENLQQASARLLIAVPIALGLVFVLLYLTFQSVKLTALIYLNVPIAATGGIVALWVRDMPFSISAGVGFIALFGIAVMNGVVLVEHIRDLRALGTNIQQAVFDGAMDRLRPVLMTATTDALGFLPMAISTTAGAEVQRPLATVVIGGVITSTLLTLVVLPSIYRWFEPGLREVDV
ncbi:MAG: efflux RND transporter permease subunit, partial [Bdellovibrionales bacterium]